MVLLFSFGSIPSGFGLVLLGTIYGSGSFGSTGRATVLEIGLRFGTLGIYGLMDTGLGAGKYGCDGWHLGRTFSYFSFLSVLNSLHFTVGRYLHIDTSLFKALI